MARATLLLLLLMCALAAEGGGDLELRKTYGLRERDQLNCGYGYYGSRAGAPHQLVVTHLAPGVADWNVAVPMPPVCKEALVTGVETAVCDGDAPPDVSMSGPLAARVHRRGALRGFAAVNVTVHCEPRPRPPAPSSALALTLHHANTRSSYELTSAELVSNELMSSEVLSHESVSNGLTSNELFSNPMTLTLPTTTTTSTSTSTLSPQEEATAPIEVTTRPQELTVATSPTQSTQLKEKPSSSLKVTIKIIRPSSHEPVSEQNSVSYEVTLPSSSYKEKPKKLSSSWEKPRRPPRRPARRPDARQPRPRHRAPLVPSSPPPPPELPEVPALLEPPQLLVTPLFRPLRLLSPRITLLQRHAPLYIFQRF